MRQNQTAAEYAAKVRGEAQAKAAELLAKCEDEVAIAEALPADLSVWMIHTSGIYGTKGSVGLSDRYSSPGVTWDELCGLVRKLPPVPLVLHKDGCTGIRPEDYKSERDREGAEVTPIHGLYFKSQSPSYAQSSTEAVWVTELRPGFRVWVGVRIRHEDRPVWDEVHYKRASSGTVTGIERKDGRRADWWPWWAERFRYSGGSHTDPGTMVNYIPRDALSHNGDELARQLAELRKGAKS